MQLYKRVALIGVDGAGAFFRDARTPHLDRIFQNGSVAYDVTTAYPSLSAECWGSMLIGVTPEVHRLTNAIAASRPYVPQSQFPTVFRVLREHDPDCDLASFCKWNVINTGIIEEGLHITKGKGVDEAVTDQICAYLAEHDPKLLFVQFDEVDGAGHKFGYGMPEHLQQIATTDGYIARIHEAYAARGFLDDTLFIVTADHGGSGYRHGGSTEDEMKVMFALQGRTVARGGAAVDMHIRDTAAIVLYALGIPQPESWTGTVPAGVFEGVAAAARPVYEIPFAHAHRARAPLPTPAGGLPEPIRRRMIAHLPFDGSTAANVTVEEGGKLYFVDGYWGRGIRLDDGYAALPEFRLGDSDFTLAFFMKLSDASADTDSVIITNKSRARGAAHGFALTLGGGRLVFNVGDGAHQADESFPLPLDAIGGWVHVLLTYEREKGMVCLSYDFGAPDVRRLPDYLDTLSFDSGDGVIIGQDSTRTHPHRLTAVLDEVLILDGKPDAGELGTYYGCIEA